MAPVREPASRLATTSTDPLLPDQCGASERQSWVGEPIDSIPKPPADATWRVVCTACARTDDLRSDRLNIDYDSATRLIIKVSCG